jgi:hypothetical protein
LAHSTRTSRPAFASGAAAAGAARRSDATREKPMVVRSLGNEELIILLIS